MLVIPVVYEVRVVSAGPTVADTVPPPIRVGVCTAEAGEDDDKVRVVERSAA